MAEALRLLGILAWHEDNLAEARQRLEEAAAIHRSGGDRWQEVVAISEAGSVAALMADMSAAFDHHARAVDLVDELASRDQLAFLLAALVPFLWELGRRHEAAQMLGAYDAIRSYYWTDSIRDVARRVTASDLHTMRLQGTRLSFGDVIAIMRRAIDEERDRLDTTTDQLQARPDPSRGICGRSSSRSFVQIE
jgi:hypothetical protein